MTQSVARAVGLDRFHVLVEGLDHPEDLATDPNGTLHTGGEAGQIFRVDLDSSTATAVASTGGFILGITFDGNGRVYACDIQRRQLVRLDLQTGEQEVRSAGTPEHPLVNPNKGVFLDDGSMLLTDSGHFHGDDGRIFRISPEGVTAVWSDASRAFPNGACLDLDGRSLLIAESTRPGLTRIGIRPDGTAGDYEVVAELPGTVPDGVSIDVEGTAYVCCYRPDCILTVRRDGAVAVLADDPEGTLLAAPTNCAWVGEGRELLVCANLGRWHLSAGRVGPPGQPIILPVLP